MREMGDLDLSCVVSGMCCVGTLILMGVSIIWGIFHKSDTPALVWFIMERGDK